VKKQDLIKLLEDWKKHVELEEKVNTTIESLTGFPIQYDGGVLSEYFIQIEELLGELFIKTIDPNEELFIHNAVEYFRWDCGLGCNSGDNYVISDGVKYTMNSINDFIRYLEKGCGVKFDG